MNLLELLSDAHWTVFLIHVLAYPIYQTLGTLRHEGAHAIAAMMCGFKITEFKIYPHIANGKWYFGHMRYDTGGKMPSSHIHLAPYYVNAVCIGAFAIVGRNVEFVNPHWALFSIIMLGISPAVDCVYNAMKWLLWDRGDLSRVF